MFEQTPLFQLNLMIYLCWDSHQDFVNPVFYNNGYILEFIEPDIPIEQQAFLNANINEIPIQTNASPELLLQKNGTKESIIIECKLDSFGIHSSNVKQANSLISLNGPYIANYIGNQTPHEWESYTIFSVVGSKELNMYQTLTNLKISLENTGIITAIPNSLGIYIKDSNVTLSIADTNNFPVKELDQNTIVMRLENEEEPHPIYLIPFDPSIGIPETEKEQNVVIERIRQNVTAKIGNSIGMYPFQIDIDELLREINPLIEYWEGSQTIKGFRNIVREYLRKVLDELKDVGLNYRSLPNSNIEIDVVIPEVAKEIRQHLTYKNYREQEIELQQTDFFDLLN